MSRQYELEVKTEGALKADRTEKEIEEARLDAACQAALGPCFK
jgi:alkylhydroperoxidase/carboxymuconolactone decarboxylase family protein YurZ